MMAGLAVAAAVLVAVLVPGDTHPTRMGADAGFVYGYLPSVVTHGDFDFSDDSFPFDSIMPHTVEGRTGNSFPIGPAVWWSPAFLAAHGVGAVARVASHSSHPAPDGRSWPYDALVGWAAFALGVIGLWATLAAARLLASPAAALLATVGVWLAGAAVYYTHVNPMQGHVAGFAASALLLLTWLRARARPDPSLWRLAALGLLGGLVALSRWEDGLLLLGPAVDAVSGRLRGRRAPDVAAPAALGGAAIVAFLPQLVAWWVLYGSPLRPPRGETSGVFLNAGHLHLLGVLFSWRHGMLSWHPVLALGLLGLVVSLRRHRVVAASLLTFFVATLVLNAASYDWWGGVSFGARRFDGMWPALAVGLALLVDRVPRRAAAAAIGALVVVNGALLLAFQRGLVSVGDAVRPSNLWHVLGRIPLAPALSSWSGVKAVWVAGLVALAVTPAVLPGAWRRVRRSPPRFATVAVAGLAAAVLVGGVVGAAAIAHPGHYDAHVFEVGYFVPQPTRPARSDRVVRPGEDVWTGIFAFPGFLPAGWYVASASGVRSETGAPARLVVRVDGHPVAAADVGAGPMTVRGAPFRAHRGILRLELRVTGAPVRLDAVRLEPAAAPAAG